MSKPPRSRQDWQEWRRLRAWELSQQGWKQRDIATALNVTPGAVSQWLKRGREQGLDGLRRSIATGAPPRLSACQIERVPELLRRGVHFYGFAGPRWTNQLVADLLEHEFKVRYHPAHISRVLRKAGISPEDLTLLNWSPLEQRGATIIGRSRLRRRQQPSQVA